MKSIRLSLIVYFLVLVAGALGTVSVIVYKLTQEALRNEALARREMLEIHYKDLCKREGDRFDQFLAEQVRHVANQSTFLGQFRDLGPWYQRMSGLGLLTASQVPYGHLATPLWVAMARDRRVYPGNLVPPKIELAEEVLLRFKAGSTEYLQINTNWDTIIRSESLGQNVLSFAHERYAQSQLYALFFDDVELKPGHTIRRAILKVPHSRYIPSGPPSRGLWIYPYKRGPGHRSPFPPPPPPERPAQLPSRVAYFQYAADTTERDLATAALQAELQRELEEQRVESAANLASLRNRLFALGCLTFALTVAGGYTLVRHGLAPLRRLSDAVSRVSERDMRLQIEEQRLPRELGPIVERLQQTLHMLERAFAREKQAAADISHELRTPLAALLTTTEVALRKPRSPEEYREVIADCRASCQQMSCLVERLLALSRLDAGVDRLRTEEIDASDLVRQCANLVRPLAEARGLSLHVHHNGPAPAILDASKVREVLTNLLHNAIEYNRPHGEVEVAVERENGHLNLEVRDTGIGIPPEAQGHIFERFYRVDTVRQVESMHTGLGLAIVKGYVDLMGGTITVDSAQGQGSTFRVQLPVHPFLRSEA